MGMSSSQARLLTLTARMHDIEYKAQRLEAQKLQMANESRRAYEDYLNELDRTKLEAKVLGQDGSMTSIPFTANAVYTYKQLTSQYALKTADDKALIPQEYHSAYQSTENLADYLKTFGVVADTISYNSSMKINPAWQSEYNQWSAEHRTWEEYVQEHYDWETFGGRFPKSRYEKSITDEQTFINITDKCFSGVNDKSDVACYRHILAYMLAFDDDGFYNKNVESMENPSGSSYFKSGADIVYSTSVSGINAVIDFEHSIFRSYIKTYGVDHTEGLDILHQLSEAVNSNGGQDHMASDTSYNADYDSTQPGYTPKTDYELLVSQWDTNGNVKTFKQWAIDMFCVIKAQWNEEYNHEGSRISGTPEGSKNGKSPRPDSPYANAVHDLLIEKFIPELNKIKYFDEPMWRSEEPDRPGEEPEFNPTEDEYLIEVSEETTFNDKNYAQWLINIWYKMEGEDEVPQISQKTFTDVVTGETYTVDTIENKGKTAPQSEGTNKYTNDYENENYIMIPQDKLSDPEWLKNCILEGWVLIQQFDKKGSKFNDTSVAVDTHLQEVADERSLKKAEAKYEADMRRIDQKDRRYDTQLAALDTERNAVKQEMETLKTVARDNVDRTFRLFS